MGNGEILRRGRELTMKCDVCGGNLIFKNGFYYCENCGNKSTTNQVFEYFDVFICYRGIDDFGRKTRDSLIANEIYKKLEKKGIKTFYDKVSLDGLAEDEYDLVLKNSLYNAKFIILLATSKDNFQFLLNLYRDDFADKTIMPIYSEMNAESLPDELKPIQSLNYDKLGATEDIVNNILDWLGKPRETAVEEVYSQKTQKRRKYIKATISAFSLIILFASAYLVFFTPFVLKNNKYNYAKKYIDKGYKIKAINLFDELKNYRNSNEIKKELYNEYLGSFLEEQNSSKLIIKSINDNIINFICVQSSISFNVTSEFKDNKSEFSFRDSNNANGKGTLELKDNGIALYLKYDNKKEFQLFFKLNSREDQSLAEMNKEILYSWLSGDVTVNKLRENGYQFKFNNFIHAQFGAVYELSDYPIKIFVSPYWSDDPLNSELPSSPIIALSAPAEILSKDYIGKVSNPYLKNGIMYVPNGVFPESSFFSLYNNNSKKAGKIENNTEIYITKENLVTVSGWEDMIEKVNQKDISEYNNRLSINQKAVFDLGLSFSDLKNAYGEVTESFYYNGGNFINFKNNNVFSFCFETNESNTENRKCLTLMTRAEDFFNNIGNEKTFSDIENALNIKIESNTDDTGEGFNYINTFQCFYFGKLSIMIFSDKEGKLSSNDLVFASYQKE